MVSRRTTMKGRPATAPRAVRAKRHAVTPHRARMPMPDLRHLSAAEVEKTLKRATNSATHLVRGSMDDAAEAGRQVRTAVKDAVTAVTRASRKIARRVTIAARAVLPPA